MNLSVLRNTWKVRVAVVSSGLNLGMPIHRSLPIIIAYYLLKHSIVEKGHNLPSDISSTLQKNSHAVSGTLLYELTTLTRTIEKAMTITVNDSSPARASFFRQLIRTFQRSLIGTVITSPSVSAIVYTGKYWSPGLTSRICDNVNSTCVMKVCLSALIGV